MLDYNGNPAIAHDTMEDFEKLGTFYLGKVHDASHDKPTEQLVLYDAKDLTTHAVIIGMTGSGKTGLGIGLLEEAAIDKIPVIAVDPKGDLGNIMLTFPALTAADFAPWVDRQAAVSQGRTPAEFAKDQATLWRNGLAEWGQDGARIKKLRDSVDMALYTPGSNAGRPISVLRSFTAPKEEIRADADLFRELVAATATSILALLDMDADPLTSREHILIATILQHHWAAGDSLDIATLIAAIQQPPVERIGVMTLDVFFPPKDRFAMAMRLNNLLAAPGFDVWMTGEPLDAAGLFFAASGQPRVSVISIAHLSDSERMFFVTMLLNSVIAWMRRQPGTGSLRAILYMDELFGYLPPTANPPSKKLFLTLLKQARAYGLGLVLATQNPVDLDYKALSNAGTWFIGRLQTERDKARVMEGLEGAASGSGFDRSTMERLLAGLGKRRFLLHNVHETRPIVFATRWVLSYLAGPFTREQIQALSAKEPAATPLPVRAPAQRQARVGSQPGRPALPPEIKQYYLPASPGEGTDEPLDYYPFLIAIAEVTYDSARYKTHHTRRVSVLADIDDGPAPVDWDEAEILDLVPERLTERGDETAGYQAIPSIVSEAKQYPKWEKQFRSWLRNAQPLTLLKSPTFKLVSTAEEDEGAFRARLQLLAREHRDRKVAGMRKRFDKKLTTLENRLLRAEQRIETEQAQSTQSKVDTAIALGSAILGAFLGRKRLSSASATRVGTAVRRAKRIGKEAGDVRRAQETAQAIRRQIEELTTEFEAEVAELEKTLDAQNESLQTLTVRAKSSDIQTQLFGLAWAPYRRAENGLLNPAYDVDALMIEREIG